MTGKGSAMSSKVHVIVGAGQAGAHAAVAMREAGFAGRIVLVGEEPHRPYERPPLSKTALTEDPEPEPSWFFAPEKFSALDIDMRLGTAAVRLNAGAHRLTLADGTELPFDRLLLTTGGRARQLAVPGAEHALLLRTLEDARRIRAQLVAGARVVCIGAGVIGLETASSAHQRGCRVTVLEAAPGVMGRAMTQEMARWVERLHREHGVGLHLGAGVAAIEPGRVLASDGQAYPADLVIAGVGMQRNTELAQAAGLEVEGGIVVDEFGRTGVPGIYAAGDVAAFWHPSLHRRLRLESWKHAQNHGIAVGRAMAGIAEQYDDVPWYWTDQLGVTIQVAGLPHETATTVLRGAETAASFCAFHLDPMGRVVAATGVNAAKEVRAAMTMIAKGFSPDPAKLADPGVRLQELVKAGRTD
jgi:3-phenylpropionate/trans-cinnamate dioxygenase ferredoxin reductase component